jgi:hypothetical protein
MKGLFSKGQTLRSLVGKTGEMIQLEDQGLEERIILKLASNEQMG